VNCLQARVTSSGRVGATAAVYSAAILGESASRGRPRLLAAILCLTRQIQKFYCTTAARTAAWQHLNFFAPKNNHLNPAPMLRCMRPC